jgi:multicomponent Na+:H+ antiporter subunit G
VSAVGGVFILLGSVLAMIGGIGAVRFPDVYSRMHAAAKAPTLGLVLVAIGAAFTIRTSLAICTLVLVVVLQLLSAPLGTHAISRATHRHGDVDLDGTDDLARDRSD